MKSVFYLISITILLSSHFVFSQEIPEGAMMIDENTIIKDESGKIIELIDLMGIMNTGEWMIDPVKDEQGEVLYLQLKRADESERELIKNKMKGPSDSNLIGKKAPDFEIIDMEGNIISSHNTKGKIVVLNFWFAACKPCIAEIPELNLVHEEFKTNPDVVFASVTFENEKTVQKFLKMHHLEYPVVADAKDACNTYGINGYPTNIVIDKHGNYFDYIGGGFPGIGEKISNSIKHALEGIKANVEEQEAVELIFDENTIFKLENEEIISLEKAMELLNSNKYIVEPKKDKKHGEYYLLKLLN